MTSVSKPSSNKSVILLKLKNMESHKGDTLLQRGLFHCKKDSQQLKSGTRNKKLPVHTGLGGQIRLVAAPDKFFASALNYPLSPG